MIIIMHDAELDVACESGSIAMVEEKEGVVSRLVEIVLGVVVGGEDVGGEVGVDVCVFK